MLFFVSLSHPHEENVINIPARSNYKDYDLIFSGICYTPRLLAIIIRIKKVKAGEYLIPKNSSISSILKIIWSNKYFERKIKIPEGYSSVQIFQLIAENTFLSGSILEVPKEGSLIADTYYFTKGTSRAYLLKRIKERTKKIQDQIWTTRPRGYSLNKSEWIILASILEKEGLDYEDKRKIGSVILNRNRKKMPLQIDATLLYLKTQGRYDQRISWNDLSSKKDIYKSKYNTYIYLGLPIAPITNPGADSLKAALDIPSTAYLYYRLINGAHVFSKTFQEHKASIRTSTAQNIIN